MLASQGATLNIWLGNMVVLYGHIAPSQNHRNGTTAPTTGQSDFKIRPEIIL